MKKCRTWYRCDGSKNGVRECDGYRDTLHKLKMFFPDTLGNNTDRCWLSQLCMPSAN